MKKLVIREGVSKGFSFIELLVVLAIMGILLGISRLVLGGLTKTRATPSDRRIYKLLKER